MARGPLGWLLATCWDGDGFDDAAMADNGSVTILYGATVGLSTSDFGQLETSTNPEVHRAGDVNHEWLR